MFHLQMLLLILNISFELWYGNIKLAKRLIQTMGTSVIHSNLSLHIFLVPMFKFPFCADTIWATIDSSGLGNVLETLLKIRLRRMSSDERKS